MNGKDEFRRQAGEAMQSGGMVPAGRVVLCDFCDTDLTDDTRSGGFLFQSKAVGPCCAEKSLASVRGYGEERFIRGYQVAASAPAFRPVVKAAGPQPAGTRAIRSRG